MSNRHVAIFAIALSAMLLSPICVFGQIYPWQQPADAYMPAGNVPPIVQSNELDQFPIEQDSFLFDDSVPCDFQSIEAPLQEASCSECDSCFGKLFSKCNCKCNCVWFAAVEATFLQPRMDRPDAFAIFRDFEQTKIIQTETETQNLDSFYAAPRLILGMAGEKRDIVFRYWRLDFAESKFINAAQFTRAGQPTTTATAYDAIDVDMYYIDAEVQRKIGRRGNMKFIYGARYVDVETSAYAQVSDTFVRNVLGTINRFNEQNYKGLGFVTGLTGSHTLPRGRWALNWAGRASGIFGTYYHHRSLFGGFNGDHSLAEATTNNSATFTRTETRNPTRNYNVQARANATAPDDTTLWIFEGQLGLSRSHQFASLPASGYFGFGFEYQFWAMPDGQLDTALALGNTLPAPLTNSPNIDLTGFYVNAGISY